MNWKLAGGEGVYLSFTGVEDSAKLLEVLSRDILSVHWTRAATHWDGAGLEKCCDVFYHKAAFAFFSRIVRTTACKVRCSRQLRAPVGRKLGRGGFPCRAG